MKIPYFDHVHAALTICNEDAEIIYMNEKARKTFEHFGEDLCGKSLYDCHQPAAAEIIKSMLTNGTSNIYTIEKEGIKKVIIQMPWFDDEQNPCGIWELSVVLPDSMPHHVR